MRIVLGMNVLLLSASVALAACCGKGNGKGGGYWGATAYQGPGYGIGGTAYDGFGGAGLGGAGFGGSVGVSGYGLGYGYGQPGPGQPLTGQAYGAGASYGYGPGPAGGYAPTPAAVYPQPYGSDFVNGPDPYALNGPGHPAGRYGWGQGPEDQFGPTPYGPPPFAGQFGGGLYGERPFGPGGPIGPVPASRSFVDPVPPPPAWRILAGHADGFEYVMLTDPEEHPRACMLKVQGPQMARVYFDNRELKQGYDGLWRFAPKEPLQMHLPNVHTVRAVVDHDGQKLERTVTFRLQPGKLLKIRFD